MRASISISLPESMAKEIDKIVKQTSLTRSEIVKAALDEYLFKFRFRKLRERLVIKAREKGIYIDEDVFDRLK